MDGVGRGMLLNSGMRWRLKHRRYAAKMHSIKHRFQWNKMRSHCTVTKFCPKYGMSVGSRDTCPEAIWISWRLMHHYLPEKRGPTAYAYQVYRSLLLLLCTLFTALHILSVQRHPIEKTFQ